ncbi:MAG: DUF4232 domain-containing protein [Acidimicrobiales bacterium]
MKTAKTLITLAAAVGGLVVGGGGSAASASPTPSCKPAQMVVSRGAAQGTAGTIYYPIIFTNTGGTCTIFGVPHIQPVVGPMHHALGPAAGNASMGEMPALHRLARGQSVSVGYGVTESGNFSVASCHPKTANGILVSLTPFVKSTFVKMTISVCTSRVSTHSRLLSPGKLGY